MPQFDFTTAASQLFWLYASFILLFILLTVFAMPKIGAVLEDRQKRIDSDLEKAHQWKSEAETAIAAYEKALASSRAEALKIMADNAAKIAETAEARQKALGEKLAAQIKDGEGRILKAKDEALAHVKVVSSDLAGAILGKLTGQSADAKAVAAAVKTSLGDR